MYSTDSDKGLPEKPVSQKSISQDEKFELLSAYLDGEVSEQERHLVTQWLASDSQLQKHYHAQLKLRQSIQQLKTDLFAAKPLPEEVSETKPYLNTFLSHGFSLIKAHFPHPPLQDNRSLGQGLTHRGWVNNSCINNNGSGCCTMAPKTSWRKGRLLLLLALGATATGLLTSSVTNRLSPVRLSRFQELSR